nr:restriction endonuclease [Armatimonas rosea]
MDGKTFEECLGAIFSRQGYAVEVTPYRGDWGADLVLVKGRVRTVVQAKRYKKSVGVRAVQEAVAAKAKYRCSEAMVVTNSTFTKQAVELARANKVTLVDREQLVSQLLRQKGTPLKQAA